MAVEMAEVGVLVNAVAPATVDTPMIALCGRRLKHGIQNLENITAGPCCPACGVARIVGLLSDDAGYVTGTVHQTEEQSLLSCRVAACIRGFSHWNRKSQKLSTVTRRSSAKLVHHLHCNLQLEISNLPPV